MTKAKHSTKEDWWRGGVIYQIYPRSFQDSNNDGYGDLAGITNRLPYIAWLGVDAIWISPFFKSPMKDFGYDIADYREVDPLFGNLADFDSLLNSAHKLNLKVMIDLAFSHTSDQHLWFTTSRESRDNTHSDWYVWADPKEDGTPPNNWLSIFGGSAWQWNPRREQYYLHNFLSSQPDLNFHCEAVQDALLDITRFWLERGVDGFRLDTINFYMHDEQLRDNPPLPSAQRNSSIAPSVNPYNYQNHLYSKNRPENLDFLKRFRILLDKYDSRISLGEVGDAQRGLEILGQYTAGDEHANMCYAFELLGEQTATPDWIEKVFKRVSEVAANGWACWAFSNHDVTRHASRWNLSDAALKLHITLLMCLRGSACLYQGEELGLHEAELRFEELQDPYGIEFWPDYKGRDGCRTPMVWEDKAPNAGFSTTRPWLPVCSKQTSRAVSTQKTEAGSLLQHYRQAIALRKKNPTLGFGEMAIVESSGPILSFLRWSGDTKLFCLFNMGDSVAETSLPEGQWHSIGEGVGGAPIPSIGPVHLDGWQCAITIKSGD